jgi:hypothetical protein
VAERAPADYSLLPRDRSFGQSLAPFLLPYAAYVGLGALPASLLAPEASGPLRFLAVAALLFAFRKRYRFGPPLTARQVWMSLLGALAALALWILSLRFCLALSWWHARLAVAEAAPLATGYWVGRAVNSALLVPVFEELFCRAWLMELFQGLPRGPGGFSARLGARLDDHPGPLAAPPLSAASVLGATLLFSLGHEAAAWLPAALYFLFTTWLYRKTASFRVCIAVHGLVNLALAVLVAWRPEMRFLWF